MDNALIAKGVRRIRFDPKSPGLRHKLTTLNGDNISKFTRIDGIRRDATRMQDTCSAPPGSQNKGTIMRRIVSAVAITALGALAFFGTGQVGAATLQSTSITGCSNSVAYRNVTLNPSACAAQAAGFDGTVRVSDSEVEFKVWGGVGSRAIDFTGNTVTITYGAGQASRSPDLYIFTGFDGLAGLVRIGRNPLGIQTLVSADTMAFLITNPAAARGRGLSTTYRIDLNVDLAPVPLPAGLLLLGTAMAGFYAVKHRRRRRA